MNPFLEMPIVLEGHEVAVKGKGLFGKTRYYKEHKKAILRARPGEIEYYHPSLVSGTVVKMKSGGSFSSSWTFDEMDQALTSYNQTLKQNPGKFGNVVINPPKVDKVALKPEPKLEKV